MEHAVISRIYSHIPPYILVNVAKMPAMLDDPTAPTIYRTSGSPPFPDPHSSQPTLPAEVYPRQVTLRDRVTVATIVPFSSYHQVPPSLLAYLSEQLNKEIENGDTYPMIEGMPVDKFSAYWFQNFGAVMLLGNIERPEDVMEGKDWTRECLGSFYIKPNYPGRSSHVCNAGFLVTDASRNRGVGRLMGEAYLKWAPQLGYTYSVFNLVYETNVASCRIWDALGFKRIGRVKGCGNLKSYPGQLIDAIIYGRDLVPDGEDFVSEERFDKIKFYLMYGKYPNGADRGEKSRLRSAAANYKILDGDKLMLRDKEVISDPQRQYEITRQVHLLHHGGINKTTSTIAEKYHWTRIKETASLVVRNCAECKELGKAPIVRPDGDTPKRTTASSTVSQRSASAAGRVLSLSQNVSVSDGFSGPPGAGSVSPQVLNRTLPEPLDHDQRLHSSSHHPSPLQAPAHELHHSAAPVARMQDHHQQHPQLRNDYMPLDPQIMEDVRNQLGSYNHQHDQHHTSHHDTQVTFTHHDDHEQHDSDSFQAMLSGNGPGDHGHDAHADGDLDMLIDHDHDDGDADGIMSRSVADDVVAKSQAEAAARAAEEAMRNVSHKEGILYDREYVDG